MPKAIRIIAIGWLLCLVSFCVGVFVCFTETWPYPVIKSIENFIIGHPEAETSLKEKITNDLALKPSRHLFDFNTALTGTGSYHDLTGLPLKKRRQKPKIFISDQAPRGYRVIYGVFDFNDGWYGAILLDPEGRVINTWQTTQQDVTWQHPPDTNVFPHGFEIAPDGSIVTAYDEGTSLTKYDFSGKIVWRREGRYDHALEFEDENTLWAYKYGNLQQIDYITGRLMKSINLQEVMKANPDIDIFGIRQKDSREGFSWVIGGGGSWHTNDVEALPEGLARYYPDFRKGDLLVSLRSVNLIFVMDPESLKVKWWRQGQTRRQHDPDWNDRGTITIFNNNMHRQYSNILELNPSTMACQTLVDGRKYEFYTWNRGKHQLLPNDGVLITSSNQGRVFEVDSQGEITFDFINAYSENKVLVVSEARFLPPDFFNKDLKL